MTTAVWTIFSDRKIEFSKKVKNIKKCAQKCKHFFLWSKIWIRDMGPGMVIVFHTLSSLFGALKKGPCPWSHVPGSCPWFLSLVPCEWPHIPVPMSLAPCPPYPWSHVPGPMAKPNGTAIWLCHLALPCGFATRPWHMALLYGMFLPHGIAIWLCHTSFAIWHVCMTR